MALKKAAAAKKAAGNDKRGPKAKEIAEEKPELENSDNESDASEENGADLDDGSETEATGAADLIDSEAEEDDDEEDDDEEDDDDDDDEDDDEMEPGEVSQTGDADDKAAEDSDDDEPIEAPIDKTSKGEDKPPKKEDKSKKDDKPKKEGIPKVRMGYIPSDTPKNQVVFVSEIPQVYKHVELVALLRKFGPLTVIHRVKTITGGNNVFVAFETKEGANAALKATGKALILNGQEVKVSRPVDKEEVGQRTVAVGTISHDTTKDQISEHFKDCGAIDGINFSKHRSPYSAYVIFESKDSVPLAIKLQGTELNGHFITVRQPTNKGNLKSAECTVVVANNGNHSSFKYDILEKAFKKYGTIVEIDIVCTKVVLGFVTYESKDEAEKAFQELNGKTVGDLEISLDKYSANSASRTILVTNLSADVTKEHLTELFTTVGEIDHIRMLSRKAIVKFTTDDAFCKSFLLCDRFVQGQPIFIEPNSMLKRKLLSKKNPVQNSGPVNKFKNKNINKNDSFNKNQNSNKNQNFNRNNNFNKNNNNDNNRNKPFNKRPASQSSNFKAKKFKKFE